MSQIMTVLGPIDADTLGVTTMHDHVLAYLTPFFASKLTDENKHLCPINTEKEISIEDLCYLNDLGLRVHNENNWDLSDVELMRREVTFFEQRGGKSILETSAPGIRTNIKGIRDISQSTGVNIIASTGLYVGVSWPTKFKKMNEKEYKNYLLKEIEIGIENTNICAGHIKAAIRTDETEELRFLRSTAEVSIEKKLLVTAHASRGTHPASRKKMLRLLLDSGLPPDKLLLCHMHFSFWDDVISQIILTNSSHAELDYFSD